MLFFSKKENFQGRAFNRKREVGVSRKTNFYNPNLVSKVRRRKVPTNNNFSTPNFSTEKVLQIVTFCSVFSISILLGSSLLTNASGKTEAKASGLSAAQEVSLITRFSENEQVVQTQKVVDLKEIQISISSSTNSSVSSVATTVGKVDKPDFYTVKAGDNLYNISKQFKVDLQKILDLNSISDGTKIQVGQQLRLS